MYIFNKISIIVLIFLAQFSILLSNDKDSLPISYYYSSLSNSITNEYALNQYKISDFPLDSIYLDMDSLYDRPTGPIAVPEKRWYRCRELKEHPEDSTDYFILTRDLQFVWPFNPAASSDYFHIYFKKTR